MSAGRLFFGGWLLVAVMATLAAAQSPTDQPPVLQLPETVVEGDSSPQPGEGADAPPSPFPLSSQFNRAAEGLLGRAADLSGELPSASAGQYGQPDLELRPFSRPGEVLELIPGLIATQHSGSGKANQYFLRGFNLDHGTDFALFVNGVPINLPTHGHGQGYLDVNWLIPELIETVDYRLGPYYADVGDFSAAGTANIRYFNTLPRGIATVEAGQFGYVRVLVADSKPLAGGQLLYAYEQQTYDGPWDLPEDFNKFNGVLRYSIGDEWRGAAITAQAYHGYWRATDQIPLQSLQAGLIGRFGTIDPTDGGKTDRVQLNAEFWQEDCCTRTKANAYINYYDLALYSNFTFFLDDPINGDQIEQLDQRLYGGVNLSREWFTDDVSHTLGFQFRNDSIPKVALNHTSRRALVNQVRYDDVDQQSWSVYYINQTQLADGVRGYAGARGDFYRFHVDESLDPADSGTEEAAIFSPKFGLTFGPWYGSELFLNWGQSFHSNDARGVNAAVDPARPLVKAEGYEIGARSKVTENLTSTVALWYLQVGSELVFVGDAGTTEPGPGSRRWGFNWTNFYTVNDWLTLDADYAYVEPRFVGGDRIPNAVENVLGTGFTLRQPHGPWYGTFRVRHYGPAALIEDNTVRSSTTTLANVQMGYQTQHLRIAVDLFNIFDRDDNDIAYFYESQPPGLPAAEDIHFHPVEPFMARAHVTLFY